MFTPEQIRSRVQQQPFVPLRLVTSAGQTFDVKHPDMIMVGTREVVVGTATGPNPHFYDQLSRLAIMHITALQDLPSPTPSSGNGQSQGT
jgi:hypothetical protein